MRKVNALLALIDDPNEIVYVAVRTALVKEGVAVVPVLEETLSHETNDFVRFRLLDIIHRVQFESVCSQLIEWVKDGADDLLYGAYLVARYQFPKLELYKVEELITQVVDGAKSLCKFGNQPSTNVALLNKYLFQECGFGKNLNAPTSAVNNCLNEALITRRGNHLSLSVIYAVVAERLGLPIKCVSLPHVMILGYIDKEFDSILFYMNPSHEGDIIGDKEIRTFLMRHNVEIEDRYFRPCSNSEVVRLMFQNMSYSFEIVENHKGLRETKELIDIIERYSSAAKGV